MRADSFGKARALPQAPQVYTPIVCPCCGNARPSVRATATVIRYYECGDCGHLFKVPVRRPESETT